MSADTRTNNPTDARIQKMNDLLEISSIDVHPFGIEVSRMVVAAYGSRLRALENAKKTGQIRGKGEVLPEAIRNGQVDRTLMNSKEIKSLIEVADLEGYEDSLQAIWHVLENVCGEHQLLPALTIDRNTAEYVIVLV